MTRLERRMRDALEGDEREVLQHYNRKSPRSGTARHRATTLSSGNAAISRSSACWQRSSRSKLLPSTEQGGKTP